MDVAQERQFGAGERVFSNDTRWGAFDRWATFLGFAHHLPRGGKDVLVPDPTEAIRHAIPSVLTAQQLEIGVVIEELGRRIPVLDGGTYRRDVEARMRPEAVQSGSDLLSPSLAYALLRLRDEQFIVLEDLARPITEGPTPRALRPGADDHACVPCFNHRDAEAKTVTDPFQGYVCWTPANVNDTVVVDAVNPSPAVFLATHRPSQMLRRDFSATEGGTLIDEEQLLQDFLAPNPGLLFLPDHRGIRHRQIAPRAVAPPAPAPRRQPQGRLHP